MSSLALSRAFPLLAFGCAPRVATLPTPQDRDAVQDGQALFTRTWSEGDEQSPLGDGLGPLYNDTSCMACHNQGGAGGAGARQKNVNLRDGAMAARFTTDPEAWPLTTRGRSTQRNSPALFGAGLLDQVSHAQVEALAIAQTAQYPWITGRVALDPEGRPGRFGWKAERPNLEEFVAAACENELGLRVAAGDTPLASSLVDLEIARLMADRGEDDTEADDAEAPDAPDLDPHADLELAVREGELPPAAPLPVDLDARAFYALVSYVAALPAPDELPRGAQATRGHQTFTVLGCTGCHVEQVGAVRGAYTDLLVHDLGKALSDDGSSYGRRGEQRVAGQGWPGRPEAAEWRTPPLWGLRDSSPYLHDGRADTVDQAIRAHGGEAAPAQAAWVALEEAQRRDVLAFLDTLVAPLPAVVVARR
jgi:CxxC motif-containing protein (DUF1111 family)